MAKKWLIKFFAITLAVLMLMAGAVILIDPYLHYRTKDDSYLLNSRFVLPGIIEREEYDSVVVGTSMVGNFSMQSFKEKLGENPIKVTIPAISIFDTKRLLDSVGKTGKATKYYIGLDQFQFRVAKENQTTQIPDYIIDGNVLSDYNYFFGYEVWFRYMPVDVAFTLLKIAGYDFPEKYKYKMSIYGLGGFSDDQEFSERSAKQDYNSKYRNKESEPKKSWLMDTMKENFEWYMKSLDLTKNEYVFFFPPYSSLSWVVYENENVIEEYLEFKRYVINYFKDYTNVTIYDFQHAEFTYDISNYCDIQHYSPTQNEWMVDQFLNGNYVATLDNYESNKQKLYENMETLKTRYPELFN